MKKTIIITGGSKGIGLACVKIFLKNNFNVINASRTNPNPVNNKSYRFIKTDVASESSVKKMFNTVSKEYGKIDAIICNAGFGIFAELADSKTEDFDNMFAVNVKGVYLCNKYAVNSMLKNNKTDGGTIINISSIGGKNGVATASIYSATKHAVNGLSASLMAEVRKDNIRVVTVCPGSVDTNFFDHPSATMNIDRETILSPDDVAETCLLSVKLPARALISELEIRPLFPKK